MHLVMPWTDEPVLNHATHRFFVAAIYDRKKDRLTNEEAYVSQAAAEVAFDFFINDLKRGWEHREKDRWFLVQLGVEVGDTREDLPKPVLIKSARRAAFDANIFRWRDPPHDAASEAHYDAEVERLMALSERERSSNSEGL